MVVYFFLLETLEHLRTQWKRDLLEKWSTNFAYLLRTSCFDITLGL